MTVSPNGNLSRWIRRIVFDRHRVAARPSIVSNVVPVADGKINIKTK